jgi:C4-dicarboxylate transporter DctM subunit
MSLDFLIWPLLIGFIALGVPIFISVGVASLAVLFLSDIPLNIITLDLYKISEMFPLLAVPCFLLAGSLMERCGISNQIIEVASVLVGRIRGGLGMVTILGCVFFAAMIGSSPATVAAMGTIMIPGMIRSGYSKEYATSVSVTGGTLGILIPPSNPMIIYAVIANVSVSSLFAAGFVPGAIVGMALLLTAYFLARKHGFKGDTTKYTAKQIIRICIRNSGSLFFPVLILGGIYSGTFTPVESSAVAVIYAIVLGLFVTRKLTFKMLIEGLHVTALTIGLLMPIMGVSVLFGRLITMYHLPQKIAAAVMNVSTDPFVVLVLICLLLFVLGLFMETLATIVILTPLLLPLITELGINPIHFGILIVMTNEVALLTPPLGINLFVGASLTDISIMRLSKAVIPFVAVLILCIFLIARFEQIVLFLPKLLFGN